MVYKAIKGEPSEFILLPEKALEIDSAGTAELKILIYVYKILSCGATDEETIVSALSERFSENEVKSALSFWRGAGVIELFDGAAVNTEVKIASAPKIDTDEAPFYSAKELSDAAEQNPEFKALVSFAEERLKKVMNESELARLYSFMDYLKMPASVIMLSIEDCVSRGKSSLRYISKQLMDFEENGAVTYEKAEELIKKRAEAQDYEHYVRELFGLGTRKLVPKEKSAINAWQEEWHFGREMLDIAFEKTVSSAKKPTISYMNKILEAWHKDGISEPQEARENKNAPKDAEKSYDLTDFFEAAVKKTKKNQ